MRTIRPVANAVLAFALVLTSVPTAALAAPAQGRTPPVRRSPPPRVAVAPVPRTVPGEVLVRFKDHRIDLRTPRGLEQARAFSSAQRLDLRETIRSARIAALRTRGGESIAAAVARLKRDPDVLWAQPNYRYQKTTNDARFTELWALENTGQAVNGVASTTPDHDIDAPEAWAISDGRNDVIVAVIDDGVAYNHPDLIANMWDGSNFVNIDGVFVGTSNHGFDVEDFDGDPLPTSGSHGTHIAGTIAATQGNSIGIAGVAPRARIMALKFNFTTEQAVRAMNFAEANGAQIIVASWSGDGPNEDLLLKERIEAFPGLVITAAGNDGLDHATNPRYPCDFDLANIVCVAATDIGDGLAGFSDYGATSVDVGAPGTDILSTVPTTATPLSEDFESVSTPELPSTLTSIGTTDWGTYDTGDGIVLYGDVVNMPYATGVDTAMETGVFDLSGATGATIAFTTQCDTEYADNNLNGDVDGMRLFYTTDDSTFWEFYPRWNEFTLDDDSDPTGRSPVRRLELSLRDGAFTPTTRLRFEWHTNANADIGTTGDGCWIDDVKLTTFDDGSSEQYAFQDGTSMAASHVAGLAALLRGFNPSLTVSQTKDIILSTGDAVDSLATAAGKTASGKRINATNALATFDPHVGYETDDVIPASAITHGQAGNGEMTTKVLFRIRDGLSGLSVTLQQFEYSIDNGATWQQPTNGDASDSIAASQSPGSWQSNSNNYVTVLDYTGAAFTFIWRIQHADLAGLNGVEQDDVRIRFKANDGVVNAPFAVSDAFTVDLLAPIEMMITAPASPSNSTSATITVSGPDVVAYRYWVDGNFDQLSPVTPVATPISLTNLTEGYHIVKVLGVDAAGNTQSTEASSSVEWTVDLTPGTATGALPIASSGGPDSTPPPPGLTNSSSAMITVGGEDVVAYKYALDSDAFGDEAVVMQPIMLAGLSDGTHTVRIIGRDTAGNWQAEDGATTITWTVDTTAPVATLDDTYTSTGRTHNTFADIAVAGDGVTQYRYTHTFGGATSALSNAVAVGQHIVLEGLAEGDHTLAVMGRDAAGNWQSESAATTYTWTVDLTLTAAAETTPVATPTNDTTPVIGITVETEAMWAILHGETILVAGTGIGSEQLVDLPALTDGIYELVLAAADLADNGVRLTLTPFVVDTSSPGALTLTGVPTDPTKETGATITVSGNDIVLYRFSFDGGAFGGDSPVGGVSPVATPIILSDLADGVHTVAVIGRDTAGNWQDESAATVARWTVDTVAPIATLTGTPANPTPSNRARMTVGGDGVVAYMYVVADRGTLDIRETLSAETPVADPIVLTNLSDGWHVVAVIGRDAAGNWQTFEDPNFARYEWTVDSSLAAPPTATPGSGTSADPIAVTFAAPGADAIRYAFDGSPTCTTGSTLNLAEPFAVTATSTITLVACYGDTPSPAAAFSYTINRGGGGGGGGIAGSRDESIYTALTVSATPVIAPAPSVTPQVLGVRVFADQTLLRVARRDIYLLTNRTLRKIPNLAALRRFANRLRVEVDTDVLTQYPIGWPVPSPAEIRAVLGVKGYREGTLLRADRRAVYVVRSGALERIPNLAALRRYAGRPYVEITAEDLDRLW